MVSGVKDLEDSIKSGSFGKVTAAYRPLDMDAIAQVDQIREFRNWVAHGRRGAPKNSTNPENAVARMRVYLGKLETLVTKTEVASEEALPGD